MLYLAKCKTVVFFTLKIQVLYCIPINQTFKNATVHDQIAGLNFYQNCQLFYIRPIFKTLVLFSIYPFYSIFQLFCHIFFYIAVGHSVTSTYCL